jgi:hypothetical protein
MRDREIADVAACPYATDLCRTERPEMRPVDQQLVACHRAEELKGRVSFTAETVAHD